MIFNRVWSMPNRNTFLIPPIAELISRYVTKGGAGGVDPFAGNNSPAYYTNDLNPETKAVSHTKADLFLEDLRGCFFVGGLWDPPYSLRQTKECYNGQGIEKLTPAESRDGSFGKVKDILAMMIVPGGCVISCGWSSCGFGKNRGFDPDIVEILLVPHGGHPNGTQRYRPRQGMQSRLERQRLNGLVNAGMASFWSPLRSVEKAIERAGL